LLPLAAITTSAQPVGRGPDQLVTPTAMSGQTEGLLWRIMAQAIVLISDADPADPSLAINVEAVPVRSVTATTFRGDFALNHRAGFTIQVLTYVKDLQYLEQPEDFAVEPGLVPLPGVDPCPSIPVRRSKVDAPALNVAVLERLPLNPRPSPLVPLRPPLLPPGRTPVAGTQLPGDFTGGWGFRYPDSRTQPDAGPVLDPRGARSPSLWPVQPGDYLELRDGGLPHRIRAISYNTWPNDPPPARRVPPASRRDPIPGSNPPVLEGNVLLLETPAPHPFAYTKEYRIRRSPRAQVGALPLKLPEGVAIDLTTNFRFAGAGAPPLSIDPRTGCIDILFAPSGGVVGRGSVGDRITFWMRDVTLDWEQPGEQLLISIDTRSGLIGAYPVHTADNYADPFLLTRDGRPSGL